MATSCDPNCAEQSAAVTEDIGGLIFDEGSSDESSDAAKETEDQEVASQEVERAHTDAAVVDAYRLVTGRATSSSATEDTNPSSSISKRPSLQSLAAWANLATPSSAVTSWEKKLNEVMFRDDTLPRGIEHLNEAAEDRSHNVAMVLAKGSQVFGFWSLPPHVVTVLSRHLLAAEKDVERESIVEMLVGTAGRRPENSVSRHNCISTAKTAEFSTPRNGVMEQYGLTHDTSFWQGKLFAVAVVLLLSNGYAVEVVFLMYPGALELFGWPIYFARAAAMGALLWSALLYLTMSRTLIRWMRALRLPVVRTALDAHKEAHVFCGQCLGVCAFVHIAAHALGTVPGLQAHTSEEVNGVIGCASAPKGYLGARFEWLTWPKCPLDPEFQSHGYLEILFFRTSASASGVALTICLFLLAWTARASARSQQFDRFCHVHHLVFILWPLLLFAHGAAGMLGVGLPLVVFVCGLPVCCYLRDRLVRLLRYYLFAGKDVVIEHAVVREGPKSPLDGSLLYLRIRKPPFLWRQQHGMYAFLCFPGYAWFQWHPFTICSESNSDTVDFIISGVGDWTRALTQACINAKTTEVFPVVALDGPYPAPTMSALKHKVMIAVGAGVGITPFLSLMATFCTRSEGKRDTSLVEAHFYWMTRSAEEFLFGRLVFGRIAENPALKGKFFLHLHVTAPTPAKHGPAHLFREAVRRQSALDRAALIQLLEKRSIHTMHSFSTPWAWVNRSELDAIWMKGLLGDDEQDDFDLMVQSSSFTTARNRNPAHALVSRSSSSVTSASRSDSPKASAVKEGSMGIPIFFGRPEFAKEIPAIGQRNTACNVHVYVCGNSKIVESCREVCDACNKTSERQKFCLYFERFG